ncbi:MAG: glycosyltransferase family 2 protein [Anaerolineales bacterium]
MADLSRGPFVSVVIPVYNQSAFLGQAIRSVLSQTHDELEIIVVDDASPDNPKRVVGQFTDPRVHFTSHARNRGLPAARNSGISASSGEYIALLDADDFFHRDKLREHVRAMVKYPEAGITYNSRFDLNHSSNTIRQIWRPPENVGLRDFVLGFPFAPSDMVFRRTCIDLVGMFDEELVNGGEDRDFYCRLALAGYKFVRVDRALNYRRYHSNRVIQHLASRLRDDTESMERTFGDSRCPPEVLKLRNESLAQWQIVISCLAFMQGEFAFGRSITSEVAGRNQSLVDGRVSQFMHMLVSFSIMDEGKNHELLLRRVFEELPNDIVRSETQCKWATSRGYLIRGASNALWGRSELGLAQLGRASELSAEIDHGFIGYFAHQLAAYENEFGHQSAVEALETLSECLEVVGGRQAGRMLRGDYFTNQAFASYRKGDYRAVPRCIARAVVNEPAHASNRGVLAILARSLIRRHFSMFAKVDNAISQ